VYPLRSIAFRAELLFLPRSHPAEGLQRVHARAFASPSGRYANFTVVPGGAELSNPPPTPGAASVATILGDRVRVQEHMTGLACEEFERRVVEVARIVLEELAVPAFVAQQFVVQSLVNPRFSGSAQEFMARQVLNQPAELMQSFEREPRLVGLRLTFPSEKPGQPFYNLRIESYQKDPRSLFIENTGVFQTAIDSSNVELIHSLFTQAYVFVETATLGFISKVDARPRSS